MTRGPEGHFYDPARHTACPWCALPTDPGPSVHMTQPISASATPGSIPSASPPPVSVPQKDRPSGSGDQATRPMASPPPLPGAAAVPPNPPPLPAGAPAPAQPPTPSVPRPPAPGAATIPPNATVRVSGSTRQALKDGPVVGWLVCLEGPDRGRDYRLHMEKNFVGRAPTMDVAIESDNTVSRDRHAIVIYDPKKKIFWALPGEASGLVYLNGDLVNAPVQMKGDDVLEVGQTKLVLIPFCGEKYTWSQDAPPAES